MISFTDSAFKRGYDEADFFEVLESKPMKLRSRKGLKGIHELLGQNSTGDYIHAAYRRDGDSFTVFHMREMTSQEERRFKKQ